MSDATMTLDAGEMAMDPAFHPELYDGVRSRRIMAFLLDAVAILMLMLLASVIIAVLGVFTFGLGWFLFPLVWPFVAVIYSIFTLGGHKSATPGMRFSGIEMRTMNGGRMNVGLALVSSVAFWASVYFLTPLILLVALVTRRKRLLHDMATDTVVVRSRFW